MIPRELRKLKNWMYCNEEINAPANAAGKVCSYRDQNNWCEYNQNTKIFVIQNNYTCIDFDGCLDQNGKILPWAKEFVEPFLGKGFYVERSRSGKGLHVIAKGTGLKNISIKMEKVHKKFSGIGGKAGIEFFTNHSITLTGNAFKNNTPDIISGVNDNFEILYKYLIELKSRNFTKKQNLFNCVKSSVSLSQIFVHYNIEYSPRKNISCPFPGHEDKKPSFTINDSADLYYCHAGCGGGSIIDFVMKMENINNYEAANWIVNKFNLEIEDKIKDPKFLNCDCTPSFVEEKKENLDLKPVKWDIDYVFVKYEHRDEFDQRKKVSQRFSKFLEKYPERNNRPDIISLEVLPVEQNVQCLLNHYGYEVKYNEIKMDFEIFRDGIYLDVLENVKAHIENLSVIHNFKIPDKRLIANLSLIGKKNRYNIWEDYLKESHKYYLKNPDKEIFEKLVNTVISSEDEYKKKFIGKFLLQMIYVGCSKEDDMTSSEYILVLKGPQYIGKTTWLQNLLPEKFKEKYFLSGRSLDLNNKDSIMETVSNILVEIGEIATTFRKSDQEAMKNFITSPRDKFRLPYGSAAVTVKRRVSLAATTNDNEYLRDLTGTRRYLTIDCLDFDKDTKIDIDMLWGYMYHLYLKKITYKFSFSEIEKINELNNKYLNKPEKLLIIEDVWDLNPDEEEGVWETSNTIYKELPPQNLLNKFTITRQLKNLGHIKFKYDTHLKKYLFFVGKKRKEG
jgi:hypothetical protein